MADVAVKDVNSNSPQLNQGTPSQNPLGRKLKKILETRLDNDKELVDALKALSTFFGDNTLRARRNLRGDVERRSLEISENFESQFKEVKLKFDEINTDVQEMNKCCQEMTERLQQSKESTAELIGKTTKLQQERKQIELQSNITAAFLEKYQLKPHEMKVLRVSKDAVVTEEFFNALTRTKQIHDDCKMLLRSKQQTAGLEIMESMALYQETSFEKLYRWTQEECRGLTGDIPDVSGALCRAVAALEDRQVLLKYTLDEFSAARRGAVVRCFIDALTRGGPGGTPRPIELYSHDPVRYVGDILGWLHQSIAGERELLHSLLRHTRIDEHKSIIFEILNHIMEGVCRPFKVRVEQVITSESLPPVLFRIANLLKFYRDTLSSLFDAKDAIVIITIDEMNQLSYQLFFNNLTNHGSKLAEKIDLPPPDLSPSVNVNDTLQLLKDVLSSHDSAISSLNDRHKDYQRIFSCILDPLIQFCIMSASRLNVTDMATYMINCLYQIQVALVVYEFTDIKLEEIASQSDIHTSTLVNEQATFILNRSGLGAIYTPMKANDCESPLSSVTGLDSQSIKNAMTKFGLYLANPDSMNMPQLELIRSTRIRDIIRQQAVDLIYEIYSKVYKEITNENNNFENAHTLVNRTPDEVKLLLS